MESDYMNILKLIAEIIIFLILMVVFRFITEKIRSKQYRILNPKEYFPEDEIYSLNQMFFLIMMGLFFINILYSVVFIESDIFYFTIFDIILSLYLAINLDKSSLKNKIILLLLIPYGSLTFLIFGTSLVGILDLIHVPIYIYFIKVYYDKFKEYTELNSLGIAIILLFAIIFISFLITQLAEHVNPLDSLVMVSNAFTSNGYAVLGHSIVGKINSLFLVWGGYILSGVATATLTSTILIKHYNNKIKNLNDEIKDINNNIEEIKDIIKENVD